MLGYEFADFYKSHPSLERHFKGVFAVDQVDELNLKNKCFAVINTDILQGQGKTPCATTLIQAGSLGSLHSVLY
jgi:hypothetical protein